MARKDPVDAAFRGKFVFADGERTASGPRATVGVPVANALARENKRKKPALPESWVIPALARCSQKPLRSDVTLGSSDDEGFAGRVRGTPSTYGAPARGQSRRLLAGKLAGHTAAKYQSEPAFGDQPLTVVNRSLRGFTGCRRTARARARFSEARSTAKAVSKWARVPFEAVSAFGTGRVHGASDKH